MKTSFLRTLWIFIFTVLCFSVEIIRADDLAGKNVEHELTLYLIPSPEPIIWNSPADLYTSFKKGYAKELFLREKYLLGHLFVGISSPIVDKPFFIGMASASKKEKSRLVLKEKIGLSILSCDLKGRLETSEELEKKMKYYLKRNRLAQITFKVSEYGMSRVLKFIEVFSTKFDDRYAPSDFYGGAFNPRFHYEGSGCTAFGMAMLELCGISLEQYRDWWVSVKVPMSVIGGEHNQGHKVSVEDIKSTHSWYEGVGVENVDYVNYSVYDPSIIFNWILAQLNRAGQPEKGFIALEKEGIPGLYIDYSSLSIPENEPIFHHRDHPSVFIDQFFFNKEIKVIEKDSM